MAEYIDGLGVRAVLAAYRRMHDTGGEIALVTHGKVRQIVDPVGMERLPGVLLCDDVLSALQALSTQ